MFIAHFLEDAMVCAVHAKVRLQADLPSTPSSCLLVPSFIIDIMGKLCVSKKLCMTFLIFFFIFGQNMIKKWPILIHFDDFRPELAIFA